MANPLELLRVVVARLRGVLRHDAVTDEIREELEFHVRMRAQEYERAGESPAEAARHARRRVGNLALLQDRGYDVRGGGMFETIVQDARYAARQLWQQPRFTAVAVLTLALGIGLSTALFSVIDAALLHPLPYPRPEQLALVDIQQMLNGRIAGLSPSLDEVRDWRTHANTISDACVERPWRPVILEEGESARVKTMELGEQCLAAYGVHPIAGREFTSDDSKPGAPPVVLLGYRLWQDRFAGSRDVLGRTVHLDTGAAVIVGVLPPRFEQAAGLVRPLSLSATLIGNTSFASRRGSGTDVLVRLRPGVSLIQAAQELSAFASQGDDPHARAKMTSLYDDVTSGYTRTIRVLAAAVGLILLLACVNVSGLLLARGAARHHEFVVRASLGASRGRIARQVLTESAILAGVSAALGILLARLSLESLVAIIPLSLPSDAPAVIDTRVLAFAAAAGVTCSLLFGLFPAWRLSQLRGHFAFRPSSPGQRTALSRRNGQVLIAAEVAIAMVLTACAGVMIRSFARPVSVDLGFDPSRVVAVQVSPINPAPATLASYYPALAQTLRAIPGVEYVGSADGLPLMGFETMATGSIPGHDPAMIGVTRVTSGFFEAMGLRLISGRLPNDQDAQSGVASVILSEAAVRAFFGSSSAVGRRVNVLKIDRQVIGVVGNVKYWGPGANLGESKAYLVGGGDARPSVMSVVVRMQPGTPVPYDRLRATAESIGPRVFVDGVQPGLEWLSRNTITPRHRTELFALLGASGMLLAIVGIFSVTAYGVVSRTQEIGIRIAVGARAGQVVRTLVGDAAVPIALGGAIGLAGALAATRTIASFLFHTAPNDPSTLAATGAGLVLVACVAAWLPARRAAVIDPIVALRSE